MTVRSMQKRLACFQREVRADQGSPTGGTEETGWIVVEWEIDFGVCRHVGLLVTVLLIYHTGLTAAVSAAARPADTRALGAPSE